MDKSTFLYLLIESVIFLLPLASVFYKMGRLSQRIDTMEKNDTKFGKDIEDIKNTVNDIKIAIAEIKTEIKK